MKRCIVVAEETTFGPIPVKGPLEQKLPELSELGYNHIELHLKYPFERNVKQLEKLLNRHNVEVQVLAAGYLYFMENISLTDKDPTSRARAIAGVSQYIELASHLGSQISIGSIRGSSPDVDQQECMAIFMDSLRACLDKAEKEGVILALEPINRYEMNLVNTVQEGLEVIKELGSPNLKLMLDTFHMNIEEPSIYESIKAAKGFISHFQVADSNRWPMGCGHLDFYKIMNVLQEIGYGGCVSAELLPKPTPEECVPLITKFFEEQSL